MAGPGSGSAAPNYLHGWTWTRILLRAHESKPKPLTLLWQDPDPLHPPTSMHDVTGVEVQHATADVLQGDRWVGQWQV